LTVATRTQTISLPYGVLHISDGTVESVQEKPVHTYACNAGIYALSPQALDLVPKTGHFDMTELIAALLQRKDIVRPHEIQGYWFDLAQAQDFDKALETLEKLNLLP